MNTQQALLAAIALPFAAGLVAWLLPRGLSKLTKLLSLIVSALVMWAAIVLYRSQSVALWHWNGGGVIFGLDNLSAFILLGVAFFGVVMTIYSIGFLDDEKVSPRAYYANFLCALGAACGAVLARNMIALLVFWGLMGIPFYLLINLGREGADAAAKKTMIILGGSDSLLILGIALLYHATGSWDVLQPAVALEGMSVIACLCLAAAAFAKAGAIPLHSWAPDAGATAPVPAAAFLPASLDKLLGIYLFARISLDLFVLDTGMRGFFVLIGAVTVIGAVMAALVQHNLRRLLGFHAVSQVGYMILGIATGTAIGVIGGLFHMLNNALYKSCLFLTAGAAERRTGTGELEGMGGLARALPFTFACALIAALAISGIPPLNGFVSKWMIYQGIIEAGQHGLGPLWVIALVAAMFGSTLTLASFVKVLHSVFLGQPRSKAATGRRPNLGMWAPMGLLAALCLVFGVFAYAVPIKGLLLPALPAHLQISFENATWQPGLAALLLLVALVAGAVIYALGTIKSIREDDAYIGGETGERAAPYDYTGVQFYRTIETLPALDKLYRRAKEHCYDIYDLGHRLVDYIGAPLRALHSGLLLTYVAWCVLGLVVLLWFLVR
ncbi:MAG: hypothetical protein J7M08_02220 [Planctomycetes bacterium]|nr:hypothetical protein [Planctomycetota bacterium]